MSDHTPRPEHLKQFTRIAAVCAVCIVLVLAPTIAAAQSFYNDAWGDEQDVFTDADPVTDYVYAVAATDGPFDWYQVANVLLDANDGVLDARAPGGWGTHMQADLIGVLSWVGSAEGEYETSSDHYRSDDEGQTLQFQSFLGLPFGVGRISTRYYYVNTVDGYHQYARWFCNNRCQKAALFLGANFEPSPYLQGQGWYVAVFITRCSMTYARRLDSFLLSCNPPN